MDRERAGRPPLSKVFWDTMVFVYLLENNPTYAKRVGHISQRMAVRGDKLFTSTLAAAEVLVGPAKTGDTAGLKQAESFFYGPSVSLIQFSVQAVSNYVRIRSSKSIRPPDAIHLACAASEGIDVFITNDKNLVGLTVPGIQFIVGLETDLF
jgi:uncharacterized protein